MHGGGAIDPKKSGHHRHELKDGLIGDSMNKHSSGNSSTNVFNANNNNDRHSGRRRGSSSGSGEPKKVKHHHRRRYHESQGTGADGGGTGNKQNW